jgi:DedD protein
MEPQAAPAWLVASQGVSMRRAGEMRAGNARVRERFMLALDGRQIAAVVVGALVVLGAVFALGTEVGQRLGARRAELGRPANLSDLEVVAGPPRAAPGKELTFPAELPRAKPGPPAPPATTRSGDATEAAAEPAPAPTPAPAALPTPAASPAPLAAPAAAPEPAPKPAPAPAPAAAPAGGMGSWTVQLGASQRREEADGLAQRVKALGPRVEEAEIPGKGRFYRVRVGRFDSREAAEKYRADVQRETGLSGMAVATGR